MGRKLQNVHICDYVFSESEGIIPRMPFCGEMDFEQIKTALQSINYDKAVMLEVYSSNYGEYEQLYDNYLDVCSFFG